jgi:hypothetical protein
MTPQGDYREVVAAGEIDSPTHVSQRDLASFDDSLAESEEVLLCGSQGSHVRKIATDHPAPNQPGPVPITDQEPHRGGQGSGSSFAEG